MTLAEALTRRIVIPQSNGWMWLYVCARCGCYLCWYLGKLHFSCECNNPQEIYCKESRIQ